MSTLPDRASTAIRWIAPPLLTNTIRQTSSLCPGTECTTSIELPRKCSNCWHTHLSHFLSVEYYFRLQSRSSYVSDSCKTDDVRCQSIYVHYENSPSPSLSFTRNRCPINAQWWRWWRWVWKSRDGWRVVQRCAALLCPRPHRAEACIRRWCASDVSLSRISGLSREQSGLGRLKRVTWATSIPLYQCQVQKVKSQLAGGGGGGILWRPPTQLVCEGNCAAKIVQSEFLRNWQQNSTTAQVAAVIKLHGRHVKPYSHTHSLTHSLSCNIKYVTVKSYQVKQPMSPMTFGLYQGWKPYFSHFKDFFLFLRF